MPRTPLPKLGAPAQRALDAEGLTTLEKLARRTRADIAELHGVGPNALARLDAALEDAGLAWRS